ncbi:hypothetical protein HMPREF1492_1023 [Atopobium sp. BS2]|uniref:hypothetical protein n=1 Tax=Atopobium sp. BS2 TaxID=936550 RepID=UPI0004537E78|nr:hypothetical protein [Atopobium sp. BS2]EWC93939.1 hypothetical protein HMPREF1492_1023 [Atopobium sp. BS2]MBS6385607.1 hypothetical protein [Atopobium sp.]MBS6730475.1 hypothetical protein [Atopobium sp.]
MTEGRNPAVVAGLLSGLVLVAEPASAYALTANEIRQTPLGAIFTGIGVGLAAVAIISGAALVVSRSVNRGEKIDEIEAKSQSAATFQSSDEALSSKQVSAASNFSPEESIVIPLDSSRRSIAAYKPKHMRASQWDMTGSIRVQSAELPVQPAEPPAKKSQVVSTAAEGVLPVRAKKAPAHSTNDYAQIAENYTKLLSWRERTVARAKGAAAVLLERLGQDPMDGLPIIERADGTVGDVGTAWWTKAVGEESITRDFGIAEIGAEAIPEDFTNHAADISSRISYVDQGVFPEKRTIDELEHADDWTLALAAMDEHLARHDQQQMRKYHPVQLPLIGQAAAEAEVASSVELSGAKPAASHKVTAAQMRPSREPNYAGVVAQSTAMPLIKATNDTSSHVQDIFDAVEREMAAELQAADERPTRELLRLIEGGTSKMKKISSLDLGEKTSADKASYKPRHFAGELPLVREA